VHVLLVLLYAQEFWRGGFELKLLFQAYSKAHPPEQQVGFSVSGAEHYENLKLTLERSTRGQNA